MIDNNRQNSYDLVISNKIVNFVTKIALPQLSQALKNPNFKIFQNLFKIKFTNMTYLYEEFGNISSNDRKNLFFYSLIKLFVKSIFREYPGQIWR